MNKRSFVFVLISFLVINISGLSDARGHGGGHSYSGGHSGYSHSSGHSSGGRRSYSSGKSSKSYSGTKSSKTYSTKKAKKSKSPSTSEPKASKTSHKKSSSSVSKKSRKDRCATCPRDETGKIKRSEKAKDDFKKQTGYPHGRPGYVIDHIVPLKRGGKDEPSNMQWQTKEDAKRKDKTE